MSCSKINPDLCRINLFVVESFFHHCIKDSSTYLNKCFYFRELRTSITVFLTPFELSLSPIQIERVWLPRKSSLLWFPNQFFDWAFWEMVDSFLPFISCSCWFGFEWKPIFFLCGFKKKLRSSLVWTSSVFQKKNVWSWSWKVLIK